MTDEEKLFAEVLGDLMERWSFRRQLGRIWALLYMRPQAMTAKELQRELGLSAGNLNSALAELQTWGVVRRTRVPGDRSARFEPQPLVWGSVANVLRARELRILGEADRAISEIARRIEKQPANQARAWRLDRVRYVQSALHTAHALASVLIEAPPEQLSNFAQLVSRLQNL